MFPCYAPSARHIFLRGLFLVYGTSQKGNSRDPSHLWRKYPASFELPRFLPLLHVESRGTAARIVGVPLSVSKGKSTDDSLLAPQEERFSRPRTSGLAGTFPPLPSAVAMPETSLLQSAAIYCYAGLILVGAFSRLTHGRYTPQYYAFQVDRAPDDGSTASLIIPIIDLVIGLTLLLASRMLQISVAMFSCVCCAIGLVMRVRGGRDFHNDAALVGLSAYTTISLIRVARAY
ncbi:hypothetical protein N7532_001549 [Penicillium argentinense]|uniref:Uncharacterized protein n=1 Tax=Penicillium argentinense TaxID=1131581 RepID=A0A9W9KLC5_9EURO|nr:uncharacterized protein N7532_001549 [Penicillium argentinense]KAJ5111014.1 hypothetical protein N7532_001549 [Penicillium argentinense]